jgi:hypothetical protein
MYDLFAQFPKQQVCRDRQYSGLLKWAAYIGALVPPAPPDKPDEQWVKERITAGKISMQIDGYVSMTLSYTVMDPAVQTNIRQHLSAFNDDAVEAAMDANVEAALSAGMPVFAKAHIPQHEVDTWYRDNGYAEEVTPLMQRQGG